MSLDNFKESIEKGYTFEGKTIALGGAMYEGQPITGSHVNVPLKTLNRHGLIAGATGTGKTKSLQVLTEQLSQNGVPVLLMDIKGDLSGLAVASEGHPKIDERHEAIGLPYEGMGFPTELLTISDDAGAKLRATVTEFGPILFSKILDLNATQSGLVSILFKYADDNDLPLIDLKDIKKLIQFASGDGKDGMEEDYGAMSSASLGTILRKIVELEQQGAEKFFGERSFDPQDLLHVDANGNAQVSVMRLTDIQDKPKLFSTFMLSLMAEIYGTFPEAGDLEKPKLAIFIDEAHLMFNEASDALLDQIEAIVKLIRSKAVGIFFVTQTPTDVPDAILGQLGLKIQHALRAFTAKDRKAIKATAENYPISDFYDTAEALTSLGIGEALVTALSEKGAPTPLAITMMRAPQSRMGVLDQGEIDSLISNSKLVAKYNEEIDNESAYEILKAKMEESRSDEAKTIATKDKERAKEATAESRQKRKETEQKEEGGIFDAIGDIAKSRTGQTIIRQVTRGLLGALTKGLR